MMTTFPTVWAPRLAAALLFAALNLGHAAAAPAQDLFGKGSPLRNTPFDPRTIDQTARDVDQARLRQMSAAPRPGRDYTKLYVKNDSPGRVSVALRVDQYAWSSTPTSELKSVNSGNSSPFTTLAWYNLAPGERAHVANTNNMNDYFYATGNGRTWAGDYRQQVVDGGRTKVVGFRHMLINAGLTGEHTINLQ